MDPITPLDQLKQRYEIKQKKLLDLFQEALTPELKYKKIIELSGTLPPYPSDLKLEKNIVKGCQSIVYLTAFLKKPDLVHFQISSEALISAGLAALLISVYHDESPELILHCDPHFIPKLGLQTSLTPGRSNGLIGMYIRMKQEALKLFLKQQTEKSS